MVAACFYSSLLYNKNKHSSIYIKKTFENVHFQLEVLLIPFDFAVKVIWLFEID